MNKYLTKIAKSTHGSSGDQEGSYIPGAIFMSGLGAGTIAHQYNRGHLTGRETLYHGSSKAGVDSIKKQGLQPNRGGGVTQVVSSDLEAKNKPYVFATKSRMQGALYSAQQEAIDAGLIKTPGDLVAYRSKIHSKALPKFFMDKGTIAKVNLPTHLPEYQKHMNPEVRRAFRGINMNIFDFDKKKSKRDAFELLQRSVHTNKGQIPAEYVEGSSSYKPNSVKEISQYIRNNPKRFLKGVGMTGVGGGLLASGAYLANLEREEGKGSK